MSNVNPEQKDHPDSEQKTQPTPEPKPAPVFDAANPPRIYLAMPILKEVQPIILTSIVTAGGGYVTHVHFEPEYAKFLDDKRNDSVVEFLKTDCTHLLFWDSDTIADQSSVKKLAEDCKDVVSGVIYKKGGDHEPAFGFWDEASRTYRTPMPFPYNELIPVDIAGTGFLLIRREVFEKVEYPWFKCYEKGQAGEDLYFCVKCKEKGIQVWVDSSVHLGHIATPYVVTIETYEMSLLWRMVKTFKEEGKFEAFAKALTEISNKKPEELDDQGSPNHAYKLTRQVMGYKPEASLKEAYLDYVRNVSAPEWAISWNLVTYIDRLLREYKPKRVLDLGSGFSTYLFRSNGFDTVSADKDPKWLDKTREFLAKHKLPTDNLGSEPRVEGKYDLCLLDYALEDRVALFPWVREHCRVIVLDDMHFRWYKDRATEFFKDDVVFDLKDETLDAFNRYARLVVVRDK